MPRAVSTLRRRVATAIGLTAVACLALAGGVQVAAAAEPANDTIAGAERLAASMSSTIGSGADRHDVYYIDLSEGQKVCLRLSGTLPDDFDLKLFAPGTSDLSHAPVFESANKRVFPESLTYVVPKGAAGRYYVAVKAVSGSGKYSLLSKVQAVSADDDLPGIAATASPISGYLNRYGDQDDVFSLYLAEGYSVAFSLSAPATTDFDVFVYDPSARSVFTSPASAEATGATSSERGSYTAAAAGTHFIDVYSAFGAGRYSLSYATGKRTKLAFTGPTQVGYGQLTKLTGQLMLSDGTPLAGRRVLVQRRAYGSSTWKTVATRSSDASGNVAASFKPGIRTEYRLRYGGVAGSYLSSLSPVVTVKPRAYLTRPTLHTRVARGRALALTGALKPRYPAGSKAVRVAAQRYEGGKWVTRRVATMRTRNYSSYSQYRGTIKLPYRGTWRMRAVVAENSRNAKTLSRWRYVTVR